MPVSLTDSDALIAFIDQLRDDGYKISATHYIAAHQLLARLLAQGMPPEPGDQLKRSLASLLCCTPKEQADFYARFEQWSGEPAEPADAAAQAAAEARRIRAEASEREIQSKRRRLRYATIGIVAAVSVFLLLLGGFVLLLGGFTASAVTPPIEPVKPAEEPLGSVPPEETKPDVGKSDTVTRNTGKQGSRDKPAVPPVTPPWAQSAWYTNAEFLFWLRTTVLLLALIVCSGFLWWRFQAKFQLQEVLVRRSTDLLPTVQRLLIRRTFGSLVPTPMLLRTARSLRAWTRSPSKELDVPRTVAGTVANAGRFTAVYGTRPHRPDYLFLMQRSSFGDQAPKFLSQLVDFLVEQDVLAHRFYFQEDPRICFPDRADGLPLTLRQLADRFPDSRLVVFADIRRFYGLWSHELEPWVDQLRQWEERIILTPEYAGAWASAYRPLQRHFTVLPASAQGLSQLTYYLDNHKVYADSVDAEQGQLPEELLSRPRRWIERTPPDPVMLERVLYSLRIHLGDAGYYWLSACAVFPTMHVNLTRYLGERLCTEDGRKIGDGNVFMQMSRLPWFCFGQMPDWLRQRLVADLPRDRERDVRQALNELLKEAELAPPDPDAVAQGIELEIAQEPPAAEKPQSATWTAFWKRRLGRQTPETQPKRGKPRDFVFHTFMSGRNVDKLAVRLTRSLRPSARTSELIATPTRRQIEWRIRWIEYLTVPWIVLIYICGWLAEMLADGSSQSGPLMMLHATALLSMVGVAGAAVLAGLGWRRYRTAAGGLLAWLSIIASWLVHTHLGNSSDPPIDWWFDLASDFNTAFHFSSWTAFLATGVLCGLFLAVIRKPPVVSIGQAAAMRRMARVALGAHWLWHGVAVATLIALAVVEGDYRADSETAKTVVLFVLALLVGWVPAFAMAEAVFGLCLKSRWLTAASVSYIAAWVIFALGMLLVAEYDSGDLSLLLGFLVIMASVIAWILWLIAGIIGFIKVPDLRRLVSQPTSPFGDRAILEQYDRERRKRRRQYWLTVIPILLSIVVFVPLGLWGAVRFSDYMRSPRIRPAATTDPNDRSYTPVETPIPEADPADESDVSPADKTPNTVPDAPAFPSDDPPVTIDGKKPADEANDAQQSPKFFEEEPPEAPPMGERDEPADR